MDAFTKTCERLSHYPVIAGNFEQEKILSRLERSLRSSGNFIIAVDFGMVWDTVNPFPSTLTLGRDFIIQSRPGRPSAVISAQGNEIFISIAEIISTIFSGNAQRLLDNFEVYYYGSPESWALGLLPTNSAIHLFAQKIILQGDAAVKNIQIFEQSGDSVIYILSNHRYSRELNAHEKSLFSIP
jgi:hypothetical protein